MAVESKCGAGMNPLRPVLKFVPGQGLFVGVLERGIEFPIDQDKIDVASLNGTQRQMLASAYAHPDRWVTEDGNLVGGGHDRSRDADGCVRSDGAAPARRMGVAA